MVVFRRKVYDELLAWKESRSSEYALLLEGARRVGKTTVVKEFARKEYRSSIIIDLAENKNDVCGILKRCSGDYDRLFLMLQTIFDTKLYPRESLIVFDEVQAFPFARQMIKYLVADGRYSYIETGSLISIRQNTESILIPSEELRIQMHPMDFEEFMWAAGNDTTVPLIRDSFEKKVPLGDAMHKAVMNDYLIYMAVGGMPQAVDKYVSGGNFRDIEVVKNAILNLYAEDVLKIKHGLGTTVSAVLARIPAMLSRHRKTFSPTMVREDSKTRDFYKSFIWLEQSKIANICYMSTNPDPALGMYLDENSLKLYLADTGLLLTLAMRSNIAERTELYNALIAGDLSMNEGMILENMVAQELVCKGHALIFTEFRTDDSARTQEVDFLIADGRNIIPLEVKSGRSSVHRSLDRFMSRYSGRTENAYVIHTKDLRTDGNVTYIPVYMTMFL